MERSHLHKLPNVSILISILLFFASTTVYAASRMTVYALSTECVANPVGVDVQKPRFAWKLRSERRAEVQRAYRILVASTSERLAANRGDVWDSGRVVSDRTLEISYAGHTLQSGHRYYWKVRSWDAGGTASAWSSPAMFEMGMLHTSDWKARWIGWRPSQRTPTTSGANLAAPMPSPLLKKEFAVAKPVREAKLYVCGLGLYDLRINGQRMDDTVLNPAHTQYDKRVLYTAHDVTHLIHRGANCVGVELGRGFYSVREQTPWLWTTAPWNSPPKLLCQILLHYTDGTTQRIVSDTSWQLCTDGPTRSDSIYWGESYDARKEKTGWDRPGYHQGDFVPADLMDPPSGALRSQMLPPMKIVETRKPMSVKSPKAGCYLFDVGPMTTGWIQFTAACPKGTMITIRYSERLSADGTADKVRINNVDGPIQTDTYVFKGEGQETWEPKFSYKGFKYVEVSGCPIRLTLANVQVKVIHSAVTPIGSFQCSNPLFNTIHAATVRTILNNLHGKPTDTPVYEKNGWMGDANLIAETALFNFDLTSFFEKWVRDIGDSM